MSTQDSNSSVSNQDQPSEQPNGDNNMSAQDSNSSVSNPYQPSEQPNGDNNNEQAEGNEFPTRYTCPIEGDPPVHAVTFGITDETLSHWGQEAGGPSQGPSDQVFEYATLHRYISHMGILHAYRDVTHPITGRAIRRDRALNCVSDVSPSIQARITNERRLRGLPMEVEGLNLTPEDMTRMQVTSRRVQSRYVYAMYSICLHLCIPLLSILISSLLYCISSISIPLVLSIRKKLFGALSKVLQGK